MKAKVSWRRLFSSFLAFTMTLSTVAVPQNLVLASQLVGIEIVGNDDEKQETSSEENSESVSEETSSEETEKENENLKNNIANNSKSKFDISEWTYSTDDSANIITLG